MKQVMIGSVLIVVVLGKVSVTTPDRRTFPGALAVHTTIESAGVVAPYTGDDNQNNTASIWYRPVGRPTWSARPKMFADRASREWRVSLVYPSPGTEYKLEVRYTDLDGTMPATVSGVIRTRADYPDVGSGGNVKYVPDNGTYKPSLTRPLLVRRFASTETPITSLPD